MLLVGIHERDFKTTTTYPLHCMIFQLCRSSRVPIWNINVLKTLSGTVDIVLIRDEATEAASNRGPKGEVQPLSENLVDIVEQAQGAAQDTTEPTNTTLFEYIPTISNAPSSSRFTPSAALVAISSVKKLDDQMATLLHHIQP